MEFLGIKWRQNYIGFIYKSPITYLYLFTVQLYQFFMNQTLLITHKNNEMQLQDGWDPLV